VRRKYRSETEFEAASIAMAQIKTLITSLTRGIQLLDSEIAAEEERTRRKDRRDPAYSILARSLMVRRDNLTDTIRALQEQMEAMEGLTVSRAVKDELLLPA
jgi:methyl-accepting chemotaxis protein